MGGDNSQTTTSGLNNEALSGAVTTIGNQLNTQLAQGVKPFTQSLYPGLSLETKGAVNQLVNNPVNNTYSMGIGDTIGEFGAIASGQRMGENDATWSGVKDQVATDVNAILQGSGRFGSASHAGALAKGLAGVDLQRIQGNEARQLQAAGMLPGLYGASTLPTQAQLQAGQIMGADRLAQRQGDADLFDRMNNAGWNTLGRASQVLAGTAPSAGQTTTQTQQQPWWQAPLQIGGTLAGAFF